MNVETNAQYLRDVEDLLAGQIGAAGGYLESFDPEALPTVAFWPGWPTCQ